jgi:hypothetical protein
MIVRLANALRAAKLDDFMREMGCFFANIPYDIQHKDAEPTRERPPAIVLRW